MVFTGWLFVVVFVIISEKLCHGIENDNTELPTEAEPEETHRIILQGDKYVQLGPQRDIVLLLGLTGAGKSTLSQYLAGNNLTAVRSSPGSTTFHIVDENERIATPESQILSHTIFPEKLVNPNGMVYYDCPGFSDTRSLAHEVAASYFIRRIIDYAKRLKFLLVIGHDFLASRTTFMEVIVHMASHIRNINVFHDGIALIVTKVKFSISFENGIVNIVSEKTEIQEIATFLMNMKKTIQNLKNEPHISKENLEKYAVTEQYIDILLQKDGDEYTKIGIMRSPNQEGLLSENNLMQESKKLLDKLIEKDLKFVVKNAKDFTDHTLSELTSVRIEKSLENINQRVQQVLGDMAKRFEVFYAQQERDLTDIFQFTNDIRQHVQIWIVFQRNYGGEVLADFPKQLETTITQLNVTFCDDYLQILSKQTNYIVMWHSVIPKLANIYNTTTVNWKTKLDPFQQHINETIHWYEALMNFNQILTSQDVQLQSKEFAEMYGIRNPNRYDLLTPKNSVYVRDGHIVQNGIHELSFSLSDQRKSFINDIWDTNMQSYTKKYDSKKKTWTIHGFMLKFSHIKEFITSQEFHAFDTFELCAIDRIYIDVDLIVPERNLTIIAPVWIVVGNRSIILNGKNAINYLKKQAEEGNGLPGRAGQSAGHFFGFATEIENNNMLWISTIGGNGGDGQNGADGSNGIKGQDFGKKISMKVSEWIFDSKNYGGFERSRLYKVSFGLKRVDVFGKLGTPGQAGGHGGSGGFGGSSGDGQLVLEPIRSDLAQSKTSISNLIKQQPGEPGKQGQGGHGGRGGHQGDTMSFEARTYLFTIDTWCHKRTRSLFKADDGTNGIDGKNNKNMESAMEPWPAITKANTVNNYKFILRASLNENGKHKNIREIKKQHEHISNTKEITKLYGLNDFVEELINLEMQWQQLMKIGCIEFYESLLRRVQKYSGDGSSNTKRTLNFLTTAIFTKIHNYRSGFDDYIVIDIKEYLKLIVKTIKGSFKQIRLTLATAIYQNSINERIDEAHTFLTSLNVDVGMRLKEMTTNIKSSKSELIKLKKQTDVKLEELKRREHDLEAQRNKLNIIQGFFSILSEMFPNKSMNVAAKVGEMFVNSKKVNVEEHINDIETELSYNEELLDRVIKNEKIFNSMITPLFAQLRNEIDGNKLIGPKKSQIGSEISRYTLTKLFIEFEHYFKQISTETESVEEVRLSVNKLQYALQTLLDIKDRVHAYKQQSELSVYLNEIASDSTKTNNVVITKLENVIKMNLICTEYKAAIKAIISFAFPFADMYLADLEPRNLCDINTISTTSTYMSATANNHITQLSNRISKADQTVSNRLDKHTHVAKFTNSSVIGPFYQWSNADHRNAIHKLLGGNEVIFVADVTKTKNWRMAIKLKEIGIEIRTHAADMQVELDFVLSEYGLTMKHLGPSCFRWHDEFYAIPSDTSVVIKKSFQDCRFKRKNECQMNVANDKLKNGDPVLSPYTMWALQLNNEITGSMEFENNLQRFADHVDIVLEGSGTFVDAGIKFNKDMVNKYYRKCHIVN